MQPTPLRYAAGLFFAALLVLYACAGSAPVRFYTLSPLSASSRPALPERSSTRPVIGVGPVTLPDYLDRPQIVTRTGQNSVEISDSHHWAGELQASFARVLVENLSILLPTNRIATYPWRKTVQVQYQAAVNVMQFDGGLGGSVTLNARWFLFDAHRKTLLAKRVQFSEPVKDSTYTALAAAQSKAIADLSRKIAAELKALAKTK